jgi:hypothetical protein
MKQEGELTEERSAAQFRDQFFLHAMATQNPQLYHELYAEVDAPEEWEIPQTPEDLQSMINELMDIGVNLNVNPDDIVPSKRESMDGLETRYGVHPASNPWNA